MESKTLDSRPFQDSLYTDSYMNSCIYQPLADIKQKKAILKQVDARLKYHK